jgi:cytosine/creatinine deaminase
MDLILRNARLTSRPDQTLCDIGIEGGRIAAIEPTLHAEGREIDVQGRLVNAGFVETHIHTGRSCWPKGRRERGRRGYGHRARTRTPA